MGSGSRSQLIIGTSTGERIATSYRLLGPKRRSVLAAKAYRGSLLTIHGSLAITIYVFNRIPVSSQILQRVTSIEDR